MKTWINPLWSSSDADHHSCKRSWLPYMLRSYVINKIFGWTDKVKYSQSMWPTAIISRWVKQLLHAAGANYSYKAHSTRPASTSKAQHHGVPLEAILNTAGWTNAKTFLSFTKRNSFSSVSVCCIRLYIWELKFRTIFIMRLFIVILVYIIIWIWHNISKISFTGLIWVMQKMKLNN